MTEESRIEKYKKYIGREFNLPEIYELTQPLIDLGFFVAPASTKYHGNYEGGLFEHSFNVTKHLLDLTYRNGLKWEGGKKSILIIGMFHDLCKVDSYVERGFTEDKKAIIDYNNDTLFTGHGEKSIILLSTLKKLTMEEVACIRYHMGAFTDKEEWKNYTKAVARYPNVLWTHHADMLSTHVDLM